MLNGVLGLIMIPPGRVPTSYVKTLVVTVALETVSEMKQFETVLNTNSEKGRLDALNDGLCPLFNLDGDGTREVHC